jgi:hypothetical protein
MQNASNYCIRIQRTIVELILNIYIYIYKKSARKHYYNGQNHS